MKEPSPRLVQVSAAALAGLLFVSVLTASAGGRWAASLVETGAFALALAWLARPVRLRWSPALIPLVSTALWGLVQLAAQRAVYRLETWNGVLGWLANCCVLFVSLQVLSDEGTRRRWLRALLHFGFAISVISVVQLFTSQGRIFWVFPSGYDRDVLGPFVYRNHYAAFIELVLPIAVAKAFEPRGALRHGVMAGVLFASVVAAASRSGVVLAGLEIAVVSLLAARRSRLPRRTGGIALAAMACSAIAFTVVVGAGTLWSRFETEPYGIRRELLRSSLAMIGERPGAGFGLGTWPVAYPAYATVDAGRFMNRAHNDWAEWAAEGGLPFVLFLLAVALGTLGPAWRSVWGLGVPAVFLHALVDYPFRKPALAAWVFALAGAAIAAGREQRYPARRLVSAG